MKDAFLNYIKSHVGLLAGAIIGLIIAVLMLTIGFFSTLLIVICTLAGALIGGFPPIRKAIVVFIDNIYDKITNKF